MPCDAAVGWSERARLAHLPRVLCYGCSLVLPGVRVARHGVRLLVTMGAAGEHVPGQVLSAIFPGRTA